MFRWIKRKWSNLNNKIVEDFENTDVYDFSNLIRNVGLILSAGIGILNLFFIVIGYFLTVYNVFPVTSVWMTYTSTFIFSPAILIGIVLLGFHLFYLSRLPPDGLYWTYRRAKKLHYIIFRTFIWMAITFALVLLLTTTQPFYSYIFLPDVMYNVIALKLLVLDYFHLPICVLMPFTSWLNVRFLRFKHYIERRETIQRSDRGSRESGSLRDDADEEEIWNMKLERLGL